MKEGYFHRLLRRILQRPEDTDIPLQSLEWKGLPRYRGETEPESQKPTKSRKEYAKNEEVLRTLELNLIYYSDVVGLVPESWERNVVMYETDIGNGDINPEWVIEAYLKGAVITYGPWADRQR